MSSKTITATITSKTLAPYGIGETIQTIEQADGNWTALVDATEAYMDLLGPTARNQVTITYRDADGDEMDDQAVQEMYVPGLND